MLSLDMITIIGKNEINHEINTLVRCDDNLKSILESCGDTLNDKRLWLRRRLAGHVFTYGQLVDITVGDELIIRLDIDSFVTKILNYDTHPYIYHTAESGKRFSELIDIMERRVDVRAALLYGDINHDYDYNAVLNYILQYGVDDCKVEYVKGSIGDLKTMNRVFRLFK